MAKQKVLCIEDLSMFLNEVFVEANKDKLEGRKTDEHGYLHYEKGKEYEFGGWNDGHTYIMSDLTFPKDHRVHIEFNENRPIRPREVKLWQSFFDNPKAIGSHQDFNLYFVEI